MASLLLHGGAAYFFWDAPTMLVRSKAADSSRIAVRLVASPKPAPVTVAAEQAVTSSSDDSSNVSVGASPTVSARAASLAPTAPTPFGLQPASGSPPLVSPPRPVMSDLTPEKEEAVAAASFASSSETVVAAAGPAPRNAGAATPEVAGRADAMPEYVAEVRRRIEEKKRYPSMARRRREEGRVLARVSIDAGGALRAVELDERAPLSLRRATRSAIEGASPFPVPPRGELRVEVAVVWQIRR